MFAQHLFEHSIPTVGQKASTCRTNGTATHKRLSNGYEAAPRANQSRARSLSFSAHDDQEWVENAMSNQDRLTATFQPYVLSLFRFITGLLLFQYGLAKIIKFPSGTMFDKVELFSLTGVAGALELVLGGMLMIGLFSRTVAFILAGEMAFAYFIGHFPKGFFPLLNGGTAAILFCFACLYLSVAGGGSISADAAIRSKRDDDIDHGFRQAAE
jgi:putative oxidoreductase